jgi:outer membrane protein assembly factor BamB
MTGPARRRLRRLAVPALLAVVAGLPGALAAEPAGAAASTDWPAYEHGPAHNSAAFGDPAITTANVASLHVVWTFTAAPPTQAGQPAARFDASPTVAGGRVFIGARTGILYALDAATGVVRWQRQLGYGSSTLCPAKGITGTATVAPDPVTGVPTVYAPGAHYLRALDAATGTQRWQRSIGPATADGNARYFNWASPTVAGGRIVMGLAANCEADLVRGGVVSVDQHTGALLHTWYAVPTGQVGASVWSSAAAAGPDVWVTTGNPDPTGSTVDDAYSIVRLTASTLAKTDEWTVPASIVQDLDFGSSPTLFPATVGGVATDLVGACNKNGVFYAWRRANLAAGPVWSRQVGVSSVTATAPCLTSGAYEGSGPRLYVAANATTVGATSVPGAVRALNPSTGAVLWERALGCAAVGSPSIDTATHVLAVPLFSCPTGTSPGVTLLDSRTGVVLRTITTAGKVFAQPVFANGRLYIAAEDGTLRAYAP